MEYNVEKKKSDNVKRLGQDVYKVINPKYNFKESWVVEGYLLGLSVKDNPIGEFVSYLQETYPSSSIAKLYYINSDANQFTSLDMYSVEFDDSEEAETYAKVLNTALEKL